MQCPIDQTTLLMSTRNDVEVDYCPQCRGVWLDRGELDKILARTASEEPPQVSKSHTVHTQYRHDDDDDHYKKRHHKKNFLTEIFDF